MMTSDEIRSRQQATRDVFEIIERGGEFAPVLLRTAINTASPCQREYMVDVLLRMALL